MQHSSFLVYRRFFYLKISLWLLLFSLVAYVLHQPLNAPNGGTWLGYTLGGAGALLIVWLLWLGVRKRRYGSTRTGPVQGWVSAHVYLGLLLVFIVTLHSGFQFGINIHTLAYVLMLLVVMSGIYGVSAYLRYPRKIAANQGGLSEETILLEISELESECLHLAEHLPDTIRQALHREAQQLTVGGSAWRQLTRAGGKMRDALSARQKDVLQQLTELDGNARYDLSMYLLAEHIASHQQAEEQEVMRQILELLGRKNALLARLRENVQYQALMDIWLYLHIPLSFALLAALIVHIVTVFLYW